MERYYTKVVGAQILTENGERVGHVQDVLIDPVTGKVVGFLLAPRGDKVVSPRDIISWNEQLVIRDRDDVLAPEDIVKVQSVIAQQIPIYKNKVMTKKELYLGKVIDFAIDTNFFMLTKLFVAKTILALYPYEEKVIPYQYIQEIKQDKIIVKIPSGLTPIKEKKAGHIPGKLRIDVAPTG